MMGRYSLGLPAAAARIEGAVDGVLRRGLRTADILGGGGEPDGMEQIGTKAMGEALLAEIESGAEGAES